MRRKEEETIREHKRMLLDKRRNRRLQQEAARLERCVRAVYMHVSMKLVSVCIQTHVRMQPCMQTCVQVREHECVLLMVLLGMQVAFTSEQHIGIVRGRSASLQQIPRVGARTEAYPRASRRVLDSCFALCHVCLVELSCDHMLAPCTRSIAHAPHTCIHALDFRVCS
jgi:hypothetical protein